MRDGWRSSASPGMTFLAIFAALPRTSIWAASSTSPERRRAATGRGALPSGRGSEARLAALDQRGSGRRPRRASEVAVHGVAARDHPRAERRRAARRAFRRRAGHRADGGRHQPRLRARSRRAHQSHESRHRRSRAAEKAQDVARLGAAVLRGLEGAGVAGCGKHFPGHGDTNADSHDELPVVEHERSRLEAVELVPFVRAIEADVATMMTAHVLVPALDEKTPASLSTAIVTDLPEGVARLQGRRLLRRPRHEGGQRHASARRGHSGRARGGQRRRAPAIPRPTSRPWRSKQSFGPSSPAGSEKRVDDALARQRRVKEKFFGGRIRPTVPLDVVGCAEHQAVAEEMAAWR